MFFLFLFFLSCSSLQTVSIPNSVTEIQNGLFGDCTSLTSVSLPASLISIGNYAFKGCTSLSSITFANSAAKTKRLSLAEAAPSAMISFPNTLTAIGEEAFQGCTTLNKVNFQGSPNTMGEDVFADCNALKTVAISSETPMAIERNVFPETFYETGRLLVPKNMKETYSATSGWNACLNIKEAGTNGIHDIQNLLTQGNAQYFNLQGIKTQR